MRKLKQKIEALWQSLTIRKKIGTFTGMVFLIIFLSMIFDVWVVKFSLTDFNRILEENSTSSNLVQALEKESKLFERYMRTPEKETRKDAKRPPNQRSSPTRHGQTAMLRSSRPAM